MIGLVTAENPSFVRVADVCNQSAHSFARHLAANRDTKRGSGDDLPSAFPTLDKEINY